MPKITWHHKGRSLAGTPKINNEKDCDRLLRGIYQQSDNVLIICGLNYKEDSGEFKCTAENVLNTVSESLNLEVYGMLLL